MELRRHAFMSHGWVRLWPPHWKWTFGGDNTRPIGEMGVLENIQRSTVDPNACYLIMNHAGARYVARLHFDHEGFCDQLCDLLPRHYGRLLREIGKLDIPYTPRMTAGSSLICFTSRGCKRNRENRVLDISSVRQLTTRRGFRITVPLRGSGHCYRRKSKCHSLWVDGTITTFFIFNIVQY